MPSLEYELPNEIDGDPAEVAVKVREQLRALAPQIEQLLHQSATQLRSAWLTGVLNLEPGLDAEELGERWDSSAFRPRLAALTRAGTHVSAAVDHIDAEEQ